MRRLRAGPVTILSTAPRPLTHNLQGKIIVISGGTQGCGAGIARVCAHEGAEGIAICGRSEANGAKVAADRASPMDARARANALRGCARPRRSRCAECYGSGPGAAQSTKNASLDCSEL